MPPPPRQGGPAIVRGGGLRRDRASLTPRKLQVLDLLARGFTNQAIAEQLTVTEKTVENYLTELYAELGIAYDGPSINPRVKAAVVYLQETGLDPRTLWQSRYRPAGGALSDEDLEGVAGGVGIEEMLLQLVEQAHLGV